MDLFKSQSGEFRAKFNVSLMTLLLDVVHIELH